MKILIVKMSAIGDVIHTLPALNALRRHFPRAWIDWLVEADAADLVRGHQALDRVIVSQRKKWMKGLKGPHWRENGRKIIEFVRLLRETHYDMVLDFQFLLKSGLLVALARADRKIGFDRGMEHMEHSYLFLNDRMPPVDMEVHALERNLRLVRYLGIAAHRVAYHLPIAPADVKWVEGYLQAAGIDSSQPLVAINPVAKWDTKLWSNQQFAQLADLLVHQFGAAVVLTGSAQDKALIASIQSLMQHPAVNAAGKTRLTALAALYQKAAMLISTDTGPMHLAAAVDTPVVALFGPTAPWRTGPYGNGHVVVRHPVACSPCFKRKCPIKTHDCMARLSLEKVWQVARNKLEDLVSFRQ